jgi:hypothetical protein
MSDEQSSTMQEQFGQVLASAADVIMGTRAVKVHMSFTVTSDSFKRHTATINVSQTEPVRDDESIDIARERLIADVSASGYQAAQNAIIAMRLLLAAEARIDVSFDESGAPLDLPTLPELFATLSGRGTAAEPFVSPSVATDKSGAARQVQQQRAQLPPERRDPPTARLDGRLPYAPSETERVPGQWWVAEADSYEWGPYVTRDKKDTQVLKFFKEGLEFPIATLYPGAPAFPDNELLDDLAMSYNTGRGMLAATAYIVQQVGKDINTTRTKAKGAPVYYVNAARITTDPARAVPYDIETKESSNGAASSTANEEDIPF